MVVIAAEIPASLAIQIKPASVHFFKAADLMQPMRAAMKFVARDKLDEGVIRINDLVFFDGKPSHFVFS